MRFGRAPRRALLFRTSTPFPKIVAKFVAPNGSKHKIEFLGDGQQLIATASTLTPAHATRGTPISVRGT